MLKIDNTLLDELGLGGLPAAEKNSFLKHIYETLEMRVGIRLADQMTNQQLDEFERYFEAKDDAGAFKWLETNFPNYKDIVQEEFDKLKREVGQSAPQILAASQSGQAAGGQPQPVAPHPLQAPPAPAAPQYPQPVAPVASPAPQPAPAAQPISNNNEQPGYQPQAAPAPAQPYAAPPVATPPPASAPAPDFRQAPQAPPASQPQYPQQQPPAGPPQNQY